MLVSLARRWLMHAKFMHELCSLLLHIPTYLHVVDVIIMFCIDFGDFPNNPLSFGFNFFWQKTLFLAFFTFQELWDSKWS
jgi:hypothetical protein